MLWIEPCLIIYSSLVGGLVGGFVCSFAAKTTQRVYMNAVEELWRKDLQKIKKELEMLSTKTVDKVVYKD